MLEIANVFMTAKFVLEMKSAIATGKGNWKDVVDLNKQIISKEKNNFSAYFEIASAYERMDDPQASLKYAIKALEHNPDFFFTLQLMTRLYHRLDGRENTYEYAKRSLKNMPEPVDPPKKLTSVLRLFKKVPKIHRFHKKLSKESMNWGKWRNAWIKWANQYIEWYDYNYRKPI
jgi:tetratricopeptide (TPR) repeat protein